MAYHARNVQGHMVYICALLALALIAVCLFSIVGWQFSHSPGPTIEAETLTQMEGTFRRDLDGGFNGFNMRWESVTITSSSFKYRSSGLTILLIFSHLLGSPPEGLKIGDHVFPPTQPTSVSDSQSPHLPPAGVDKGFQGKDKPEPETVSGHDSCRTIIVTSLAGSCPSFSFPSILTVTER